MYITLRSITGHMRVTILREHVWLRRACYRKPYWVEVVD